MSSMKYNDVGDSIRESKFVAEDEGEHDGEVGLIFQLMNIYMISNPSQVFYRLKNISTLYA